MLTVFCRACRAQIDPSDTFCKACGADQRPPVQQPTQQMPVNAHVPVVAPTAPKRRSFVGFFTAILLLLVVAAGIGLYLTHLPAIRQAEQAKTEPLTVRQLRIGMLQYNGKTVKVHALVVDFGDGSVRKAANEGAMFGSGQENAMIYSTIWDQASNTTTGWLIADDVASYMTTTGASDHPEQGGFLLFSPAVPSVHYHDYVEISGTYEATSSTILATSVQVVGHLQRSQPQQ